MAALAATLFCIVCGYFVVPRARDTIAYGRLIEDPRFASALGLGLEVIELPAPQEPSISVGYGAFSLPCGEYDILDLPLVVLKCAECEIVLLPPISVSPMSLSVPNVSKPDDGSYELATPATDWDELLLHRLRLITRTGDAAQLEEALATFEAHSYVARTNRLNKWRVFSMDDEIRALYLAHCVSKVMTHLNATGCMQFETDHIRGLIRYQPEDGNWRAIAEVWNQSGSIAQGIHVIGPEEESTLKCAKTILQSYRFLIDTVPDHDVLRSLAVDALSSSELHSGRPESSTD